MFKRTILSIAALTLAGSAFATGNQGCNNRCGDNSGDTTHNTTNQGGTGGTGTATAAAGAVAVGVGTATAGVIGSGNSDVRNTVGVNNTNVASNTNRNEVNNANLQGQQQGQQQSNRQGQDQGQQQSTSSGAQATGGSATGNGTGNKTTVTVENNQERSAPAIAVGGGTPLPTGCRYVFGIGGSNANGSVGAAGIPLWKDSECKGATVFAAAARFPGVFTVADLKQVACENFDAMENTPTCKQLKEEKRVEGILDRSNEVAELKLMP